MNLIALLVSLLIERLATQFFHWRRMRWMDRLIDAGFRSLGSERWPALAVVVVLAVLLALPVFVVTFALGDSLLGFPYLALAIVVLFFSLGPKDIGEDVDEYCVALEKDDDEAIAHAARALIEGDVPDDPVERMEVVESAVFVQANNRLFAVIFWFVVLGPLGPLGAWAYRVTDLVRRRAVFSAARASGDDGARLSATRDAAVRLHAWLAWIPARLTALGYAIAGHFDGALQAWRDRGDLSGPGATEALLARVGRGAMVLDTDDEEDLRERAIRGASAANRLVFRQLLIWVVLIAALTLYGWTL